MTQASLSFPPGVELLGTSLQGLNEVLTPEAIAFITTLQRDFNPRRQALLSRRQKRQQAFDRGQLPDFESDTLAIRAGNWQIAPVPAALEKRQVEITGPVDAKTIINALNSQADMFMADFEDASSPTWANMIQGQHNLMQAVAKRLSHVSGGKCYSLNDQTATLIVRPRGWHLDEVHLRINDIPMSASLFDFGLFFFHNAKTLLAQGKGPYFYLPKLQGRDEAELWNAVFTRAQQLLDIPVGSIKATVLIEHVLAVFEMDEILYALRDHIVGLNAGRWDYLFSILKTFKARPNFWLPDRSMLTMQLPFMQAYCRLLVQTCHRRGAHAIGGMAALIPSRRHPEITARAFAQVRHDKECEALIGFDGTWVAHPDLVNLAREVFQSRLGDDAHQKSFLPQHWITNSQLIDIQIPDGQVSEAGVKLNLDVSLRYLGAWLTGQGAVAINQLMEDAATVEISRTQLWHWLQRQQPLSDGSLLGRRQIMLWLEQAKETLQAEIGSENFKAGRYNEAAELLLKLIYADTCPEFFTLQAYEHLK